MNGDVNWLDKAVDWSWTLLIAAGVAVAGLVHRVFRHEARLIALEKGVGDGIVEMKTLEAKIDANQDKVMGAIDRLRADLKEDHRMVVAQLLERVPRP